MKASWKMDDDGTHCLTLEGEDYQVQLDQLTYDDMHEIKAAFRREVPEGQVTFPLSGGMITVYPNDFVLFHFGTLHFKTELSMRQQIGKALKWTFTKK